MKIGLQSHLKRILGIEKSANTQSSGINGDGNSVDQSITINVFSDESPAQALAGERGNAVIDVHSLADGSSPPTLRRTLKKETLRRAARRTENPVTVFLAGPYIEPEKESESGSSAASILRFQLFHRLKGENFAVSLGTYPESIDAFKAGTGEYHNAAEAELGHAKNAASLVVMIPDSPGSFAEIGAFSLKKEICTKMIILADVTHEKSMGYLNNGPVACAKALGSEVKNVDYNDVDGCFEVVIAYSNRVKTQIQLQSRLEA